MIIYASIDCAIEIATELHPDHWPRWAHEARRAYLDGDAWTSTRPAYTNTLRLALAADPPKRTRKPKVEVERRLAIHEALEQLREAFREVDHG